MISLKLQYSETCSNPPNCSKDSWKLLPFLISWLSLVTWWVVIQKIYSEMHLVSCTNTHHDITDLLNHGRVKNAKTWIFWEQNVTFLKNPKIINQCLIWHILRTSFLAAQNLKLFGKKKHFFNNAIQSY